MDMWHTNYRNLHVKQCFCAFRNFFDRLSVDFPPLDRSGQVLPGGGSAGSSDPNVTSTTPRTTLRPVGSWDPFTLFNTNSSFGLNSIVSSAATQLKKESRDGFQYISECSLIVLLLTKGNFVYIS